MKDIQVEPHVNEIVMPENLKVATMVDKHRKMCRSMGCDFDYYSFAFGQSPFHPPRRLVEDLGKYAEMGQYSACAGVEELRGAVARFNARHFDMAVDPEMVIIGPGTKSLIHMVLNVVKGGIIIPSPSWIGYYPQARLLAKQLHIYHLDPENGYRIDPGHLDSYLEKLDGAQQILVINNPHNPTGVLYTREELEEIAGVCRRRNTLILADEIYALTTYEPERFASLGTIYPEGVFITNGLSKDRSAGGYRLGYCILPGGSPEGLIESFKKMAATLYTSVTTPIQYAAVASFGESDEMEDYFRVTRDIHGIMGRYYSRRFNEIKGLKATSPEGGFYFYLDFNGIKDDLKMRGVSSSNELGGALISHPYHIATVTGDACMLDPDNFGARIAFVDYDGKRAYDKYLSSTPSTDEDKERFAVECAPNMVAGLRALEQFVKDVKSG